MPEAVESVAESRVHQGCVLGAEISKVAISPFAMRAMAWSIMVNSSRNSWL